MVRVLELFAGIGACSKALTNLGIEHEIVDAVEIDKYAIQSFNAIHGTNFKPQDITTWDKDIECDLIMHGSPCQDFSVAGRGAGGDKDSGTRSSLMYETLRIVGKVKPKVVIWENVKNLLSKKHRHNFDAYIKAMYDMGYNSYWQVLNAKDYGVPQNRERVFTISLAAGWPGEFKWPEKQELTTRLKDVLEDEVDEKYYLSDEQVAKIRVWEDRQKENGRGYRFNVHGDNEIATTMTTRSDRPAESNYIKVKNATAKGYLEAYDGDGVDCSFASSSTRRGRVQHGIAQTIPSATPAIGVNDNMRIRKLTPRECWRLMGFSDADFDKAQSAGISNSQLYKQAGNSIVVNVLEDILRNLLIGQ